jgi:hypothetical protein
MGVSGQRHAPAALLPPRKGPPVPIVQEAGWAPEPVWTQRLEEKSFAPAGDRTPIAQSIVRHHTAWATLTPVTKQYESKILTPCNTDLLEKLIVAQLIELFVFYGTRRFITVSSIARWLRSTPSRTASSRYILIQPALQYPVRPVPSSTVLGQTLLRIPQQEHRLYKILLCET